MAGASTAWEAIRASPLRYLVSRWPLRALAYVTSGVVVGVTTLFWLPVTALFGAFVLTPLAMQPFVALERRRVTLMGGAALSDPHRRADRPGLGPWLRLRYTETVTWRELAYAMLQATALLAFDAAATVIAVVMPIVSFAGLLTMVVADRAFALAVPLMLIPAGIAVVGTFAVAMVAIGHSEIARLLLSPGEAERVRTLTRSRARLIDAFEVERRRIERDLHDGAQQRLVSLTMTLGLAELERGDVDRAQVLISQAGEQARGALADLRDLIRGIHPRVLTDLGLPAAVAELTDGCGVPLTIAVRIPDRLPSAIESAAYFVVAEAVTNAVKHARPTRIWVTGGVDAGRLVIEVRDDGVGGADPAAGTGLTGLADRVDGLDGTLTLISPLGGPTTLRLDLPCGS